MRRYHLYIVLVVFGLVSIASSCDKEPPSAQPFFVDLTSIPYNPTAYTFDLPVGFPPMQVPADNPMTDQGVALGRRLFYDPILSADSSISCASCHTPALGFADDRPLSIGVDGLPGKRQSMSLANVGYRLNGLFWDGREQTLEAQALEPIEDELEFHSTWPEAIDKIKRQEHYQTWFREAFGIDNTDELTKELVAKAIAQFERTLISGNSDFDKKFRFPFQGFPTTSEQVGFDMVFAEGATGLPDVECNHCHVTPYNGEFVFLTSDDYFNTGLDSVGSLNEYNQLDPGRGAFTNNTLDLGKMRAPTLRNISLTAPYMHDGRFATLDEVVDFYLTGGHPVPNRDSNMAGLETHGASITPAQRQAILDFLNMMTDTDFVTNPDFQNPW